jgi:PKD repeat protein
VQVLSNLSGLVTFSASITGTVSGSIRFYEWDFGDNTSDTTTGPQTSHRYTGTGIFVVRLRVVTTTGQEGFTTLAIRVA